MKKEFQFILDNYLEQGPKVDSNNQVYYCLCKELPKQLRTIVNNESYTIKGSEGAGNRTDYPWISILNNNVAQILKKAFILFSYSKETWRVFI